MAHYKVMVGADCYGRAETKAQAENILAMHKHTKNGHKKESKISTLDIKVVLDNEDYPSNKALPALSYKPGKYPSSGEFK